MTEMVYRCMVYQKVKQYVHIIYATSLVSLYTYNITGPVNVEIEQNVHDYMHELMCCHERA